MNRYDPARHHRRSIRLKGYDYSQSGAYFVTLVTHQRICWFDRLPCRIVIENEWQGLADRFPTIRLDAFVVMPDHVHFILWLDPPVGAQSVVGAQLNCAPIGQSFTVDRERPTLGQVVRAFKAVVTRRIHQTGVEGFAWQRNYHEHVIRDPNHITRA